MNNYIKIVKDISYIDIYDLIKLKYKNETLDDKVKKFNDKNILVTGLYSYVDKNYNSIYSYLKDKQEENLKLNYQEQLLKIYSYNKDINIRNEIVNLNLSLVPYMINYLHLIKNRDLNELYSIGYIGLIKAIEKFNLTKNIQFSTYACSYIKGYILRSINRIYNLPYFFTAIFLSEKKKIKNELICDSNLEFYEKIVDITNKKLESKKEWSLSRKNRVNMAFPINYDDLDECYMINYNMDYSIDYEILKEAIEKFLRKLSIRKELLARLYYGLEHDKLSTSEILDIVNIDKRKLYYHLESLKKEDKKEILDVYYPEIFDSPKEKIIKR